MTWSRSASLRRRWKISGIASGIAGQLGHQVDIPAHQHQSETGFLLRIETAIDLFTGQGIAMRAKQHVPDRQRIIVAMQVMLMVDTMHFRPLNEVPDPVRRPNVGMYEVGSLLIWCGLGIMQSKKSSCKERGYYIYEL